MTKLREDLNDFLEKWDKATAEHNRSEKVSEVLKPVFIVKEIGGEDKEEIADEIWNAFDEKEKLFVLEKAGYDLDN